MLNRPLSILFSKKARQISIPTEARAKIYSYLKTSTVILKVAKLSKGERSNILKHIDHFSGKRNLKLKVPPSITHL